MVNIPATFVSIRCLTWAFILYASNSVELWEPNPRLSGYEHPVVENFGQGRVLGQSEGPELLVITLLDHHYLAWKLLHCVSSALVSEINIIRIIQQLCLTWNIDTDAGTRDNRTMMITKHCNCNIAHVYIITTYFLRFSRGVTRLRMQRKQGREQTPVTSGTGELEWIKLPWELFWTNALRFPFIRVFHKAFATGLLSSVASLK